jgi:hypothetical protein
MILKDNCFFKKKLPPKNHQYGLAYSRRQWTTVHINA